MSQQNNSSTNTTAAVEPSFLFTKVAADLHPGLESNSWWCEERRAGCCDGLESHGNDEWAFRCKNRTVKIKNKMIKSLSVKLQLYWESCTFSFRIRSAVGCQSRHLVTFIVHCQSILSANWARRGIKPYYGQQENASGWQWRVSGHIQERTDRRKGIKKWVETERQHAVSDVLFRRIIFLATTGCFKKSGNTTCHRLCVTTYS